MSDESNICAVCGGMTRIAYTIEFRQCMPHSISVDPNQVIVPHMRLCPGHPEPVQKHDGKLGAGMHVRITGDDWDEFKGIRQVVIMDETFDGMGLPPAQALSLLDWLEQNRETLQRLAKEQEGKQ